MAGGGQGSNASYGAPMSGAPSQIQPQWLKGLQLGQQIAQSGAPQMPQPMMQQQPRPMMGPGMGMPQGGMMQGPLPQAVPGAMPQAPQGGMPGQPQINPQLLQLLMRGRQQ